MHDIEELHRKASAYCIKSEFEAALELWRQMLELEPGDERAIEGVRLCEKLVAGEPIGSSPPAAADPSAEAVDDLELAIDDALFNRDVCPSTTVETREQPEPPIELCPPSEPAEDGKPSPVSIDIDAAQELQRRVEILLQEARDHFEQENVDDAEQVLVRVLILDDENQDALKLQQQIQEFRQPAGAGPDAPPTAETAADVEFDLSDEDQNDNANENDEEVEAPEVLPLATLEPVELAEPAEQVEPWAIAVDDAEAEPAAPDADEAPERKAVVPRRPSQAPQPKRALPPWAADRRVQLGAGGLLVLLAVVFGLGFFGGEEPRVPEPVEVRKAEKPVEAGGEEPMATEEPAAPVVQKDPALLLREAQSAFEAEDWAAAVVGYNELLKQEPDHPVASENLPTAMERYREQRDERKTWNDAVGFFEAGNFRDALRSFYHLGDLDMDVARVTRYQVNGWYNLGVTALKGNRCSKALEHFDEALVIRPGDQGVVAAMGLADACLDAGSPGAEVLRLEFRGLED